MAICFRADAGCSTTGSPSVFRLNVFHKVSNCSRVRVVSHGVFAPVLGARGSQTPLRVRTGVLIGTSLGLPEADLLASLAAGVCACANVRDVSRRTERKRGIGQKLHLERCAEILAHG